MTAGGYVQQASLYRAALLLALVNGGSTSC